MHTIRLCNCWFTYLFITFIYCIDGILCVLGPMHLAGFATQNISCSCWATGLVLWYLSQVWVVINTARPKKCVSIVMTIRKNGMQTLSTQRTAILMHSRKNIAPIWRLVLKRISIHDLNRSLDSDSSRFCFQDPCHKHKISVALATQNS